MVKVQLGLEAKLISLLNVHDEEGRRVEGEEECYIALGPFYGWPGTVLFSCIQV